MFGGLATISNNSPILRRISSRPVVFDQELNEMKSGSLPIGPAIMPSPILLWRFKVLLFLIWGFSCCKISWDSVMRMSADLRDLFLYEAFLYFNPLLLVCATWMTIVVPTSMTSYLYLYSHGEVSLAASQPVLLYAAVAMLLIFPFDIFYLSSRYYLLRTLWRILLPLQAITFSDFFVADILTSMAKVLSDLERSACRMVHRQVATIAWFEADSVCGSHSIAIPLVLVLPYMCRFFQCLRQYKDTGEKTTLFNALKYSTAIPVIFLSALKYHVFPDRWTNIYRPLWLLSSVVNSLYSFYWDVTRDWDLSSSRIFMFKNPSLISNLLHARQWLLFWVLASNLILRCTWTYKLSAHLRHNYITVFTITLLEMLRRFQWIFFRVDNEWNKMNHRQSSSLPMTDMPKEEDKLLPTDHNV
ncbi:hypothetical protein AQUCO_02000237v1 [Aquilegia coerulea]|uniref:EXS domain-containing protein n=1 Tax=Aquilegia coerulea TaxID=218851 RepID=A0A2G5DGJ7_AQUCA|nr:hypothetical protein AQUCO_02000237v1 [Aquilegia coerulea]